MQRYGCKWGQPHDLEQVHDGPRAKWEKCKLCRRTFRWAKGVRGRIDNPEYLKAHARNFAQKGGATNALFMRLYEPEKTIIKLS